MAEAKAADFKLPPPASTAATPQPSAPQPSFDQKPATNAGQQSSAPLPALLNTSLSSQDAVIGVAIVLAFALVFLFVRSGLRSHLIAQRASPSAASSASWSLFAFLLTLTATVVFGLLGNLWQVMPFLIPMAALIVVTLVLFGTLYNSAARGRR